jgi:hypothetical protein
LFVGQLLGTRQGIATVVGADGAELGEVGVAHGDGPKSVGMQPTVIAVSPSRCRGDVETMLQAGSRAAGRQRTFTAT